MVPGLATYAPPNPQLRGSIPPNSPYGKQSGISSGKGPSSGETRYETSPFQAIKDKEGSLFEVLLEQIPALVQIQRYFRKVFGGWLSRDGQSVGWRPGARKTSNCQTLLLAWGQAWVGLPSPPANLICCPTQPQTHRTFNQQASVQATLRRLHSQ